MPEQVDQTQQPVAPVAQPTQPTAPQPAQTTQPQPAQADPTYTSQEKTVDASGQQHPQMSAKARLFHGVLNVLGGGDETDYKVAEDGTQTPYRRPRGNGELGRAILAGAVTGLFAGAKEHGPNAGFKAFAAGGEAGMNQQQKLQADRKQQAQQNWANNQAGMLRKAQTAEANSRTALNTAEAEKYGIDAIEKQMSIGEPIIEAAMDRGVYHEGHVTQDELRDGMTSGKYDHTEILGPIDGYREVVGADGQKHLETTHAVLKSTDTKVPMSQELYDRFAAAHVTGFNPGFKVPAGQQLTLGELGGLTQKAGSFELVNDRLNSLHNTLKGTPYEKQIPKSADDVMKVPGADVAMQKFQRFFSHSSGDLYDALMQMGAPKLPNGAPNPDAHYVNDAARALGGLDVLRAAHEKNANERTQSAELAKSTGEAAGKYPYEAKLQGAQQSSTTTREMLGKGVDQGTIQVGVGADGHPTYSAVQPEQTLFGEQVQPTPGGVKQANKVRASFKKNLDNLAQTEQTFNQFQAIINTPDDQLTGAQSVVGLFAAIGISAEPLKGKGFRVNQATVEEHANALGWTGRANRWLLNNMHGDVVTPGQLKDYARIAANGRRDAYVAAYNEAKASGVNPDFVLPQGNGQTIDDNTLSIYMQLAGNDPTKAVTAAQAKGWK